MKFVKGQWYSDESKTFWLYCGKEGKDSEHLFRKAGNGFRQWVPNDVRKQFTPATLIPDFSNAKEGDKCFSAEDDFCIMLPRHDKRFVPAMNSNGGFDVFLPDGRLTAESKHPTLFNSFAQFMAYWQEEALKLKGGE